MQKEDICDYENRTAYNFIVVFQLQSCKLLMINYGSFLFCLIEQLQDNDFDKRMTLQLDKSCAAHITLLLYHLCQNETRIYYPHELSVNTRAAVVIQRFIL